VDDRSLPNKGSHAREVNKQLAGRLAKWWGDAAPGPQNQGKSRGTVDLPQVGKQSGGGRGKTRGQTWD